MEEIKMRTTVNISDEEEKQKIGLSLLQYYFVIRDIICELGIYLLKEALTDMKKLISDNKPQNSDQFKKIIALDLIRMGYLLIGKNRNTEARQLFGFIIRFKFLDELYRLMLHLLFSEKNYYLIPHLFKNIETAKVLIDDDDFYRVGYAYYKIKLYDKALQYLDKASSSTIGRKDRDFIMTSCYYHIAKKSKPIERNVYLKLAMTSINQYQIIRTEHNLKVPIKSLLLKKKIEAMESNTKKY